MIGIGHIFDLLNSKELSKNKVYVNYDIFDDETLKSAITDCAKLYDDFWKSDASEDPIKTYAKYEDAKAKTNELINFK